MSRWKTLTLRFGVFSEAGSMRDGEWTLTHAGGSVTFGLIDNVAFLAGFPELGDAELTVDDADRPRMDGRAFGSDYRGGVTLTFDLRVTGDTEQEARQTVAMLARLWRADSVRGVAGAFAELRTRQGGRERSTFGRPRRWSVNDTNARHGSISILCDFATTDDVWYESQAQTMAANIAPGAGGGLMSPLAWPLTTTMSSDRSIELNIGGEVNTWPVIEFTGPITNPTVGVIGLWEIGLTTSLVAGQTAKIDTRPWSRAVTRGTANIGGLLTRSSSRLSKASIPPGRYELYFRGTDSSGTADLYVSWRNGYTTL
jgi:hypothetical protein